MKKFIIKFFNNLKQHFEDFKQYKNLLKLLLGIFIALIIVCLLIITMNHYDKTNINMLRDNRLFNNEQISEGYCYTNEDVLILSKVITTNVNDIYSDNDKIKFGKQILNDFKNTTYSLYDYIINHYNVNDEVSERSFKIAIQLLNKEI